MHVYQKMVKSASEPDKMQRNLKQVQRVSEGVSKENLKGNVTGSQNLVDDLQTLMSMAANNEFVQQVTVGKHKPVIICYTADQIKDMRRFCSRDAPDRLQSVIGIDRTFNLSAFYVTVTVFKNKSVIRPGTQDHPIMLGPMCVHGDGQYATYSLFFSHLRDFLQGEVVGSEIGLDDAALLFWGVMTKRQW
jgi:hypothetical protein